MRLQTPRRLRTRHVAITVAILSTTVAHAAAGQSAAIPDRHALPALPRPVGFVNDFAGIISSTCRARIQRIVLEVRAKSKGEIVVVTLASLHGRPIEEWGLRFVREWGVGFAGTPDDPRTNTGVVIVAAPGDRRSRVELGSGSEAFIADSLAGRILDENMIPSFRRGDFGTGLLRGVDAMARLFARRFAFTLESTATDCEPRTSGR